MTIIEVYVALIIIAFGLLLNIDFKRIFESAKKLFEVNNSPKVIATPVARRKMVVHGDTVKIIDSDGTILKVNWSGPIDGDRLSEEDLKRPILIPV